MGLSKEEASILKKSIQDCSIFQGKYYLWHIYHILKNSPRSSKEISKIARHLVQIIDSINKLNNAKNLRPDNNKTLPGLINTLNNNYSVLAEEKRTG